MKIRCKVWIETDEGEPIISEGKYRLLKEVEKTSSIKSACESLSLTYKRAHSQIKTMEKRLGKPLLRKERGKGSVLTKEGKELIRRYEEVLDRAKQLCDVDF